MGISGPVTAQTLDICQKQITKISGAFQAQVLKALQSCADLYRRKIVKAQLKNLTHAELQQNLEKNLPCAVPNLTKFFVPMEVWAG